MSGGRVDRVQVAVVPVKTRAPYTSQSRRLLSPLKTFIIIFKSHLMLPCTLQVVRVAACGPTTTSTVSLAQLHSVWHKRAIAVLHPPHPLHRFQLTVFCHSVSTITR
jgi:hypothetical protein